MLLRDVGQHDLAQPRSAEAEFLSQLVAQHVPHVGIACERQGYGDQRDQQRDEHGELASDRSEEGPGNGVAIRRGRHRGRALAFRCWCTARPDSVPVTAGGVPVRAQARMLPKVRRQRPHLRSTMPSPPVPPKLLQIRRAVRGAKRCKKRTGRRWRKRTSD